MQRVPCARAPLAPGRHAPARSSPITFAHSPKSTDGEQKLFGLVPLPKPGQNLDARIESGEFTDAGSTKEKLTRPVRQILAKDPVVGRTCGGPQCISCCARSDVCSHHSSSALSHYNNCSVRGLVPREADVFRSTSCTQPLRYTCTNSSHGAQAVRRLHAVPNRFLRLTACIRMKPTLCYAPAALAAPCLQ